MDKDEKKFNELSVLAGIQDGISKFGAMIELTANILGKQLASEQQKSQRRCFELHRLNAAVLRFKNRLKRKSDECLELQTLLESVSPGTLITWKDQQKARYPRRKKNGVVAA